MEDQADGARKHDQYFGSFDDSNDASLVMSVRELA
jgi:hypothetical protein